MSMELVWMGFLALLTMALVKRHGWEYVPLLLLLGAGRWYAGQIGYGAVADAPTLVAVGGVWIIAKMTRTEA